MPPPNMVRISGTQEADPARHEPQHQQQARTEEHHHEHAHHYHQEHHYHEDEAVSPIVTIVVVFTSTLLALRLIREIIVTELRERREAVAFGQAAEEDGVIQVNDIPEFV